MSSTTSEKPLDFVVDDSFRITGRGLVLAPTHALDRFPANTELIVMIAEPGGVSRRATGKFVVEHVQIKGGGTWHGVVVLDDDTDQVPMGSRVTCSPRAAP